MSANVLDHAGLEALMTRAPYHQWLGLHLLELTEDYIDVGIRWREEFVVNVERRYTHGGILAAVVDLTADWAVAAKFGRGVPTIDMRVDYHKVAMPGDLHARGRIIKLGRTVSTAEASVFDGAGALLASGRGVYHTVADG